MELVWCRVWRALLWLTDRLSGADPVSVPRVMSYGVPRVMSYGVPRVMSYGVPRVMSYGTCHVARCLPGMCDGEPTREHAAVVVACHAVVVHHPRVPANAAP